MALHFQTTKVKDITLRKAGIGDLALLRVFEQGLVTAERSFTGMLKRARVEYYDIAAMLTDPMLIF